jgi:hypothetical protein
MEIRAMSNPLVNLPLFATLGVASVLIGSLARVPIDLGAWLLGRFDRWLRRRAG